MRTFFKDIYAYHLDTNTAVIDKLIEHQEAISSRSIGLLSHMINAHQIWNARILKTQEFDANELHSLDHCKMLDRSNYNTTMDILTSFDLGTIFAYKNGSGKAFESSLRDILFHVTNHFTHHRGQLISDLRVNGIAPPKTDFIFYKR